MSKMTSYDETSPNHLRVNVRLEVPASPPATPEIPPPVAPPSGPDVPPPEVNDPVPAESPAPVREPPVMPTPMAKASGHGRWSDSPRVTSRTRFWAGGAGTLH
jgi:hypothetical protein